MEKKENKLCSLYGNCLFFRSLLFFGGIILPSTQCLSKWNLMSCKYIVISRNTANVAERFIKLPRTSIKHKHTLECNILTKKEKRNGYL